MKLIKKIGNSKAWLPITIVALALINWMAWQWHARIDLTNEKRFTLSSPTKKLIKQLDGDVQVDIFLNGALPSGFQELKKSTEELLKEFKDISNGRLTYHFTSADDAVDGATSIYSDTLAAMGLYPINLKSQLKAGEQQQLIFPFALIHYNGQLIPVKLYEGNTPIVSSKEINSAEAMMEYRFDDAINRATTSDKPMIAYSVGNGEPTGDNTYDLVENTLRKDGSLFTFNLNTQAAIPDTFRLLVIVKPSKTFTAEEKLKIDQFVMRGGKLLMFVDKLDAEMDSLQIKNEVIAYDRGLDVNDLLFHYGVRINPDLVMDLQCDFLPFDVNGNGQFELLPWNYFPVFESKNNHIINKNLGYVAGRFVNSIDTVEAEGITKTVILSSSANSRTIATPALISGKENVDAPEDGNFKKANIPVGVLLEGKFQSLYTDRLSQAMRDSLQAAGESFLPQCEDDNKMIIVSDGDIVLNSVVKGNQPLQMGENPYTYGTQRAFPFANRDFLQNCISYLIDNSGLMEVKGKDRTLRLLDVKKIDDQRTIWQIINIATPILLVVLFGLFYQWWRKRKYTF